MKYGKKSSGFTLIEMLVIAPIVILAIGAFIAVIVNLTGEVMSSRGSNVLTYDVQDALNRIEADTKLSTSSLAVNSINIASTSQGYVADGAATPGGSTVNFTNIDKTASGGSPASLILNALVTNGNPLSPNTMTVFLANKPNDCSDPTAYAKNTPMTMNIVYYIANNTLWRRVIMPQDYANAANRCGSAPWQQPSCMPGYTVPFCATNDQKLIEGVSPSDFSVQYANTASSSSVVTAATDPSTSDANRNAALQSTSTVLVSITARRTIAGRDITSAGSVRVTRLDTNATSIAKDTTPTAAPNAPSVSSAVSDGHNVTFSWPAVSTATSYSLDYRINGGAWISGSTSIDNATRSFVVTQATHTDTVDARVIAKNSVGNSGYGNNSITIPLWAPLNLQNGWSECGGGASCGNNIYTSAGYTKTKTGIVMVKGLLRNPGSPAIGSIIAKLPADYVPTGGRLMFGTSSNGASARVDVTADGSIVFSDSGSPIWFALDTIHYMAASAPAYTRTNAPLQSGFTNYNNGYAPASYVQDTTGRVSIQGLLNTGTLTNGTVIFPLPAALQPPLYQHYASRSGSFHHLGVSQSSQGGGLLAKGDGSGAYSINVMYFPASYGGWTALPLLNGWVTYDATTFATPAYTKASDGIVSLKGLVKSGTTTAETAIANLPAGFRPAKRILYTTVSGGGWARVDIKPSGDVSILNGTNSWFALDDIMFMAEQ